MDDEVGVTKVGKLMLERLGYTIDPLKALEKVKRFPGNYNLVITDMTMPHMDGDLLIQKIKEINPDIPIILATGFNSKIDKEKAMEMGVHQYIEKPFDRFELALAVKAALPG